MRDELTNIAKNIVRDNAAVKNLVSQMEEIKAIQGKIRSEWERTNDEIESLTEKFVTKHITPLKEKSRKIANVVSCLQDCIDKGEFPKDKLQWMKDELNLV